jgi:aspartate carbamoyltransferase catalytic subunit
MVASLNTDMPVINAGDGGHQHPTQTLTDLLTIRSLKGRLDNFTVGLCGDLKFGRTVHSLIKALSRHKNVKFVLISPEELRIPDYIREEILIKNDIEFKEVERLENVIGELDVLYMTRVQRERFFNEADYIRLKDSYILNMEKLEYAKKDMIILHPLPRVNEISVDIDDDPRACYFKQARYGMFVRMALIMKLLGVEK